MAKRSNPVGPILALLAVVALIALGYLFRDQLLARWGGDEPTLASPEVAAAAQTKLDQLAAGADSVRLSSVELTSLLRYRSPPEALQMVNEPTVEITADSLRLTGMVPTDRLPSDPNLDKIRLLLPDTAKLVVQGTLLDRGPGRAALQLDGVEFAGVPIPPRYFSSILTRLGRREEAGLEPNAVGLHLPPRVSAVHLSDGYLVLTSADR